jgi:hypothetical protein
METGRSTHDGLIHWSVNLFRHEIIHHNYNSDTTNLIIKLIIDKKTEYQIWVHCSRIMYGLSSNAQKW